VRLLAVFSCSVLALAPVDQRADTLPERIVATRTQAVVTFESLVSELAPADVLLVNSQTDDAATRRFEMALVQALAGRRPQLVVALDVVDRVAQDPLEHYQMEHLSDAEFAAEARLSPARASTYLPLMKLARARLWPMVATGPAAPDDRPMRAAIALTATTAAADAKRPLVVSLHTHALAASSVASIRQQLAGRRVVVLAISSGPAPDAVTSVTPGPVASDYVAYVRER
jgi:hypothetical protein